MKELPEKYLKLATPLINAAKGFLEEGMELVPVAFVGSLDTGKLIQVVLRTDSQEEKDRAALAIQAAAVMIKADFILIITEAWQLKLNKSKNYKDVLQKYGSVANTPRSYRDEIVSFTMETREGIWVSHSIIKPLGLSKKKRTIDFPKLSLSPHAEGRFIGLLPPEKTQH